MPQKMSAGKAIQHGPTFLEGIDVSHFQGAINWTKVRGAGIRFAYAKATEGTIFEDNKFDTNRVQAKRAGVLFGAYHFWRPALPAVDQAEHFFTRCGGRRAGELQPMLDVEDRDSGLSSGELLHGLRELVDETRKLWGTDPIIYVDRDYWSHVLLGSAAFHDCPLWIAHWTTDPYPQTVGRWPYWTFWQFSSHGVVPGILGHVDRDRFNGTIEQLLRLTAR